MSETPKSRLQILGSIAMAPFWVLAFIAAMLWMLVTVPVMFLAVVVLFIPAEFCWLASPFVGLLSPSAGHWLAGRMEPAMDRLEATITVIWKPLEWLFL